MWHPFAQIFPGLHLQVELLQVLLPMLWIIFRFLSKSCLPMSSVKMQRKHMLMSERQNACCWLLNGSSVERCTYIKFRSYVFDCNFVHAKMETVCTLVHSD